MTHYYTFTDSELKALDGKAKEWYDDGSLLFEGRYKENKRSGTWTYYDPETGELTAKGQFKKGERDGKWEIYGDSTNLEATEYEFKGNKAINGQTVENDVFVNSYKDSIPYLKSCEDERIAQKNLCTRITLKKSFFSAFKRPKQLAEVGLVGTAIIHFEIDETGKVTKVSVPRGLSKEIKEKLIEISKTEEYWMPAFEDGKPVASTYELRVEVTP